MAVTYTDSYLKADALALAREAQATLEVDALGVFQEANRDRLIEIRAYILTCLESTKAPHDLFELKLRLYRGEFDLALSMARAAAAKASPDTVPPPAFAIQIERG